MGIRTLTLVQKALLAVIIFIILLYVGYFVAKGREAENTEKSDFSVSAPLVCKQVNNGQPNGIRTDSTCQVCRCFAPIPEYEGIGIFVKTLGTVDLKHESTGAEVTANVVKQLTPTADDHFDICSEMRSPIAFAVVCAVDDNIFYYLLNGSAADCQSFVKREGRRGSLKVFVGMHPIFDEHTLINYDPYFEEKPLTDPACSIGKPVTGGSTGGSAGGGSTGGIVGVPGSQRIADGCGKGTDGSWNKCFGEWAGKCGEGLEHNYEDGYWACKQDSTNAGGGGIQAYPPVKCTNLGSYVDPTTGKAGRVKCSKNKAGEDRVCYETRPPVRGDATTGNGKCVEKNNAAGQICKYGIQCARETEKAPGLEEEYEVTGKDMRCEKRDKADGGLKNEGICMPRYRGEEIGCGMIADGTDADSSPDNDRDEYCRTKFAAYENITEGEKDKKDYEKLEYSEQAYCHKVRNAAGNEVEKRFECRLQRGEGKPCNPKAGNQCFSGFSCTKVTGKNKYTCQADALR